jgi:hypothetical protein
MVQSYAEVNPSIRRLLRPKSKGGGNADGAVESEAAAKL